MAAQASGLEGFRTRAPSVPLNLARLAGQGPFGGLAASSSGAVPRLGRRGGHPPPKDRLSRPFRGAASGPGRWSGWQWRQGTQGRTRVSGTVTTLIGRVSRRRGCSSRPGRDGSEPERGGPAGPCRVLGGRQSSSSALSGCGWETGLERQGREGEREGARRAKRRSGRCSRPTRSAAPAPPSSRRPAPGPLISERAGAAPRVSARRLAEPWPREARPARR